MKLGNHELEPSNSAVSASTLHARHLFMTLVQEMMPEVVRDLLRVCNSDRFPDEWTTEPMRQLGRNAYLLMLKDPRLLDLDLGTLGFDSSAGDTPILHFCRFLRKNAHVLRKEIAKSREDWTKFSPDHKEHLIQRTAVDRLLPNWAKLEKFNNSASLRGSICVWAERSQLTDEWCLDFAINVLKAFKFGYVDRNRLDLAELRDGNLVWRHECNLSDWTWRAWSDAIFEFGNESFEDLLPALLDRPQSEQFDFTWRENGTQDKSPIEVHDTFVPYSMTDTEFKKRVELKFWHAFFARFGEWPGELVGNIERVLDNVRRFQAKLSAYTKECIRRQKGFGKSTVEKSTGDKHFRWLVEFQLAGSAYKTIAERENVVRTTIMEGVRSASRLTGLTLREATRPGRPKGVKETQPRRRAER